MACTAFVLTLTEIARFYQSPCCISPSKPKLMLPRRVLPQTERKCTLFMVSPDQMRKRKRIERQEVANILGRLSQHSRPPFDNDYATLNDDAFQEMEWSSVPEQVDPHYVTWRGNFIKPGSGSESHASIKRNVNQRSLRKRSQIENFAGILRLLAPPPGSVVVDFGSGSGNLALGLAHSFPELQFIGVDMKSKAIDIFRERAEAAGLTNVDLRLGKIENFDDSFDYALALHTCGASSDMVMEQAIQQKASFFVSPCCIGKIKVNTQTQERSPQPVHSRARRIALENAPDTPGTDAPFELDTLTNTPKVHKRRGHVILHHGGQNSVGYFGRAVTYPRSEWLGAVATSDDYALLARSADRSEATPAALAQARQGMALEEYEHLLQCAACKTVVETDRQAWATQQGYAPLLLRMRGMEEFAKTDLLAGFPAGSSDLQRLEQGLIRVGDGVSGAQDNVLPT